MSVFGVGLGSLVAGAVWPQGPAPLKQIAPLRVDDPALVALGKTLFYDKNLSNPPGQACVSCHDPATGYSYPNPAVNAIAGPVPGVVKGRSGSRKPPSAAYAPYMPTGVPHYDDVAQAWVGGLFWDGRARDALEQAKSPFLNPNEMNNVANGHGSPAMVVKKVASGPSGAEFKQVFGQNVFQKSTEEIYDLIAKALVAFEASPEVSPFTSKYDAYLEGKAQLSAQELLGLRIATGTLDGRPGGIPFKKSAHCMDCHAASTDLTKERDVWTNACYANLGIPRNPMNPYYGMTNRSSNPMGFNSKGQAFVDPGLAGFLYSYLTMQPFKPGDDDPLRIMGAFKAPSLRNVDKRPSPNFVKSYMHNGYFKSLKDVVHFYNSRNLTTVRGEVIDFTQPDPYAGLKGKPLFPRPEYMNPNTLINPTGKSTAPAVRGGPPAPGGDLDAMQIGNLMLTEAQEDAVVAFLKTLSDGYFKRDLPPVPARPKGSQ